MSEDKKKPSKSMTVIQQGSSSKDKKKREDAISQDEIDEGVLDLIAMLSKKDAAKKENKLAKKTAEKLGAKLSVPVATFGDIDSKSKKSDEENDDWLDEGSDEEDENSDSDGSSSDGVVDEELVVDEATTNNADEDDSMPEITKLPGEADEVYAYRANACGIIWSNYPQYRDTLSETSVKFVHWIAAKVAQLQDPFPDLAVTFSEIAKLLE
jgi:hypothetical protein